MATLVRYFYILDFTLTLLKSSNKNLARQPCCWIKYNTLLIRKVIVSVLLIPRNRLLTTNISLTNIYRAVFNSTLRHIRQRFWLHLEMRLSKLSLVSHTKPNGSFNYYVLTKRPKFSPPPLLFALIRFW